MSKIQKLFLARKNFLQQMKKEKEKELLLAPGGTLRVCCHNGNVQYYHRTDPKDCNGKYIIAKEKTLAQALAQKDYDRKILLAAEKEIKAIEKYLSACPEITAEDIYNTLHSERKKLVNPIMETDEQYIKKWNEVTYKQKSFKEDMPEFYTIRDERVRSKSEVIIANLLFQNEIPYRYEYPIHCGNVGLFHPDFTVLNVKQRKEWYWEHLGMMDNPTYVESAIRKIDVYEQNGIVVGENLILTYETKSLPLNQKTIQRKIDYYLKRNSSNDNG